MRKVLVCLLVVLFLFALVGAAYAHPLGGPPGQAKKGAVVERAHPHGGPPGLLRQMLIQQPAYLYVYFADGSVQVVEGVAQGMTVQFTIYGAGTIIDMFAEQNGRLSIWEGQGSEYADMSEYDEAIWQIVWTSGGAKARGRQVLTIGYAEGIIYEVEEPVEPPIEEPEEPIEEPEEPIEEPVEPIEEE